MHKSLRLFLLLNLLIAGVVSAASAADFPVEQGPGRVIGEHTRQCGEVLVLEDENSEGPVPAVPVKVLEVEVGFSWQLGLVQTERYLLSVTGPFESSQYRIRIRRKLLARLNAGDRICIRGKLLYKTDEYLFPVLVPEQVDPWVVTATHTE